jgi:hypothetical protein
VPAPACSRRPRARSLRRLLQPEPTPCRAAQRSRLLWAMPPARHQPARTARPDPAGPPATRRCRFSAGPPYEDIAFRIVNKEWEYSHKRGYKCTFERGILHLYFNFKRARYRR